MPLPFPNLEQGSSLKFGESDIKNFFNVNDEIAFNVNLSKDNTLECKLINDNGYLILNAPPDFTGNIHLDVTFSDGKMAATHKLTLNILSHEAAQAMEYAIALEQAEKDRANKMKR